MVAVNYYQHHIGDFNSATRHLTRVERSIYRDLIELYYDTESPLTANIDRLARKVMATNDHEFEALNAVLGEFFILEGDVYTHSRCDEELAKVYAKSDKARASAEKRWEKSKTKTPKPDQYQSKSNATAMRPQCDRNASGMLPITQDPIPNNPIPSKNTLSGKPDYGPVANRVISELNRLAGKNYRLTDNNRQPIIARLRDGYSEHDCAKVIANRVMRWAGTEQAQYLRPETLFRPKNFESYLNDNGETGSPDDNRYDPNKVDQLLREMFPANDPPSLECAKWMQ